MFAFWNKNLNVLKYVNVQCHINVQKRVLNVIYERVVMSFWVYIGSIIYNSFENKATYSTL